MINIIINDKYIVVKKLGEGSFGSIYKCIDKNDKSEYAIKFEKNNVTYSQLNNEYFIYKTLNKYKNMISHHIYLPNIYDYGNVYNEKYFIFDLMNYSLQDFIDKNKVVPIKTAAYMAVQILNIIRYIHLCGIIHRDIKPSNIMFKNNKLYIIDFGLSKFFIDKNGNHIALKNNKKFIGTTRYCSINIHEGLEYSRRDDLESCAYVLIYIIKGSLPWQGIVYKKDDDKNKKILNKKKNISTNELCNNLPNEFEEFLIYSRNLNFTEEPNYKHFIQSFKKLFKSL